LIENSRQHQQMLLNEVDLLNMRITDLLNQLNQVVRVLFEENQRLTAEFDQIKKEIMKKQEMLEYFRVC